MQRESIFKQKMQGYLRKPTPAPAAVAMTTTNAPVGHKHANYNTSSYDGTWLAPKACIQDILIRANSSKLPTT